jgi:acyl-CoA reductase-like NAD-dependent aldehyde dehydrogenase
MDVCEKLISSLEVGSVYCNMLGLASPHVPFGGYKESGFGRDNGVESVDEFTQIKAIYQAVKEPKL